MTCGWTTATHLDGEDMLDNLKKYEVVLASGSPRRKELLAGLGVDFSVHLLEGIEESYPSNLPVEEIPVYLSKQKAEAYQIVGNELIITADTVVIVDGEVLGKPDGEEGAKQMLRALSGRRHSVVTGVTITTKTKCESFGCLSEVEFTKLSEEEIDYYVTRYKPFDKAGAYGIQEWIGYMGITGIHGSFYNVMGLPVQRLYVALKSF